MSPAFVLIDDASGNQSDALLYQNPTQWITAYTPEEVEPALGALRAALASGKTCAGFFAYELGYCLEEKLQGLLTETISPLLSVGVFDAPTQASFNHTDAMEPCATSVLTPAWDEARYTQAFSQIHDYIAAGDIYQANLTFPLTFTYEGNPLGLYKRLREAQRAAYGAVIRTPDGNWILSLSPELMIAVNNGMVTMKPMKGTARRDPDAKTDARIKEMLSSDEKSQAENLMIVDLVRNDVGRIARTGSVKVRNLFEIETYPTLHQMTSTVTARLSNDHDIVDVLRATFPCGSVTGAPKIRAMEIISAVEAAPRGVYCGAVGLMQPDGACRLNVAIRTLEMKNGQGRLSVGSGIVADSVVDEEYRECLLKARFLTGQTHDFSLIETLRWTPANGFDLFAQHIERLAASAQHFNYPYDEAAFRTALQKTVAGKTTPQRVRALLNADGYITAAASDLISINQQQRLLFVISDQRVRSDDPLLQHKTTLRKLYDDEWTRWHDALSVDEVVFMNERFEIAEGSRTTVFVRKGDTLYTPPLSAGVLNGCLRRWLFSDPRVKISEKTLTLRDLETAQEVLLGNSVRGLVTARLLMTSRKAA